MFHTPHGKKKKNCAKEAFETIDILLLVHVYTCHTCQHVKNATIDMHIWKIILVPPAVYMSTER